MAKRLRATGRKRTFTKRVIGRRFPSKRVAMQKSSTTTLVSRTLYPELPAIFKCAVKLSQSQTFQVGAQATIVSGVNCCAPQGFAAGVLPEGLQALMYLYGSANVDMVQLNYRIIPYLTNANVGDGAPLQITTCVMPFTDFQVGGNDIIRASSYPDAKTSLAGHPYAQEEINHYHSVDVRKFLNYKANTDGYRFTSTQAGVIAFPAAQPDTPMVTLVAYNDFASARTFLLRREVTYHITFSSKHLASTNAQA